MGYKSKKCKMDNCSVIFTPTSGSQKYCDKCKLKAMLVSDRKRWRNKNRKNNNYKERTVECKFCGKEFTTYYKRKISCGSECCNKARIALKNKIIHRKRSKKELRLKGRNYYYKNRKKCLEAKAVQYRKKHKYARPYIPGKVNNHSIDYIREYVEERGYTLISNEYVNNRSTITLRCQNGHEYNTTFHGFQDSGNKTGIRCMTCYLQNNYVSRLEQLVRDYFKQNFPEIVVIYNDRKQIHPKELDLYFPDKKVAVEICGLYWHSEGVSGKTRKYHYDKMMSCYDKNIRLITVFEDEMENQFELVISRIKQALGITNRIIYARECYIKEIDNKEANRFFMVNHLQGKSTAKNSWGLFYNDELVSVCSVDNTREHIAEEKSVLELKRFCTLSGITIVGGDSKLFSHVKKFAKDNGYTKVRSYCDMRYTNIFNPVYEVLGFGLLCFTKYTPHYFKNGKRYKDVDLPCILEEMLTDDIEYQLILDHGYRRIWDCGYRTYEINI